MLDLKETGMLFVDGNYVCRIPCITNTKDIIKFNGVTYIIDDKTFSITKNRLGEHFCLNVKFNGHQKYTYILKIQRAVKSKHNIDILIGADDEYWEGIIEDIHKHIVAMGWSQYYDSDQFKGLSECLSRFLNEPKEKTDDIIRIFASHYYG